MPKQIKIVNVNDDSTYTDITDAVVENEKEENEPEETPQTEEVVEPEQPKPKARAKRVPKPKVAETEIEPETPPEAVVPKPRAKRVAKVKILEQPMVIEPPVEKPKAVRKPRVKKEEEASTGLKIVVPGFPPRLSRTAAREALYHSLAASALG